MKNRNTTNRYKKMPLRLFSHLFVYTLMAPATIHCNDLFTSNASNNALNDLFLAYQNWWAPILFVSFLFWGFSKNEKAKAFWGAVTILNPVLLIMTYNWDTITATITRMINWF